MPLYQAQQRIIPIAPHTQRQTDFNQMNALLSLVNPLPALVARCGFFIVSFASIRDPI